MKRNQWAAALLSLLLFLCGVAVGALGHRYYASTVHASTAEAFRAHYIDDMKTKVGVTDTQLQQIEAILDDTKAKYKVVRDQFRPQMLAIKNEQIARVKAVLTPEQVPVYERLIAEHERRAREQDVRDGQEGHRH
jgi:hypothetical protein